MLNWLIGDMGTPGEYMYQPIHWWSTAVVAAATILAGILGGTKCLSEKQKRSILFGVCWFQLGFEVLWRLIYVFIKGDSVLCWWPLYPCNLGGILVPIFALTNCIRGKKMFYLFGFVGGVLTFIMPDGIFCTDVMVFPVLKSILQHTGLLIIPVLEYTSGAFRPNLKDMGWITGGLLVHLVNCEGITRLLGFTEDYMFLRSGLPFVIPGVPQIVTLGAFAIAVLALLCILSDWKGSFSKTKVKSK